MACLPMTLLPLLLRFTYASEVCQGKACPLQVNSLLQSSTRGTASLTSADQASAMDALHKSSSNSTGNEPSHCLGGVRHHGSDGRYCCKKSCRDTQCGGSGCKANSGVDGGQSKSCCVSQIEDNGMTCSNQDDWGCQLPPYLSCRAGSVSCHAEAWGIDSTTYCQREKFVKFNENTGVWWTIDGSTHVCKSEEASIDWSKYPCSPQAAENNGDYVVFKCGGYYFESINAKNDCKKNSPCKKSCANCR